MSGTDILAAIEKRHKELPCTKVDVPEWGCTLWFPSDMTVAQKRRIGAGIKDDDEGGVIASFILHQAQDKAGSQLFEVSATSRATLEGKGGLKVMMRIMEKLGSDESPEQVKNA